MLNDRDLEKYSRSVILDEIGEEGQLKLLESKVLVIGAGGLGSPVLTYLSSSGVGTIGIIDFDKVELSNLQRQVIHSFNSIGSLKVDSARKFANNLNTDVKINTYSYKLDRENAKELFSNYDLIVDCSDNFETRYIVNTVCLILKKAVVFGAINKFRGYVMSCAGYSSSPCYKCVFPDFEDDVGCSKHGIFPPIAGIIGSLEASFAIKSILEIENKDELITIDLLNSKFNTFQIAKDVNCSCNNFA